MMPQPAPSAPTPKPASTGTTAKPKDRASQLRDTHRQFIDRLRTSRLEVLRNHYENVLFYLGHQWLAPLPDGRGFMRANLRRDVPRPVTNRYKAILDAIDAPLSRLEPALQCVPGSDKDDDRMTADLGNRVVDYVSNVVQLERVKGELAKILVTCNNAYAHAGLDPDAGAKTRVPKWACATCGNAMSADKAEEAGGMCPECQSPLKPSTSDVDTLAEGELYLEAVTPFETWVDYAIPRIEDQPIVMIRRLRPRAWAEARYPSRLEEIKKIPALTATEDIGVTYLQSIIRLTPGGASGTVGFGAAVRWDEAITDDVLYALPCTDYPDGLYLRILGGEMIADDLPLSAVAHDGTVDEPGTPFIPVIHFGYDPVPGTHVHTGPADHLKDLQRQRNRREAAIELYFARMANGVWLIPEGTDVQTPTGEEGWVMRYSPLGSGGAKPERVEGNRLPSSFVEWLEFTDKQMEDIAGTYEIFRGQRPPNVSSGYAMQILTERAQSRFAHVFANYEVAWGLLGRTLFLLFRNHAPEEVYYKIKGEEARWTVYTIRRADLRGAVDMRVESGSARPKTALEKKASAEQAMSLGLIDLTDPDVRLKLLHLYGIPELMASAKADDEQIAREHESLIAWARQMADPQAPDGAPAPNATPEELMLPVLVDPLLDNHQLHLARHRQFMLTPEYLALPDWVRQAFRDGHFVEHLYESQMNAMQQAQQPAPPTPPGPPSEGQKKGGGGENAGAARAQGQAQAMQSGGKVPGVGIEQGQFMGDAAASQ